MVPLPVRALAVICVNLVFSAAPVPWFVTASCPFGAAGGTSETAIVGRPTMVVVPDVALLAGIGSLTSLVMDAESTADSAVAPCSVKVTATEAPDAKSPSPHTTCVPMLQL